MLCPTTISERRTASMQARKDYHKRDSAYKGEWPAAFDGNNSRVCRFIRMETGMTLRNKGK
jgi:hypothetical protein